MNFKLKYISTIFILCFIVQCLNGQSGSTVVNPSEAIQDTTTADTTLPRRNTFKILFSGKPGKAALYSLVLPSGGQIYNKKWWKVPLALGIDGWFTYRYLQHRKDFNKYDLIYKNYLKGIEDPDVSQQDAKTFRENSRRNKEYGLVYLILGHLATVLDAYVDRHLMDFDASEDLGQYQFEPAMGTITLLSIRIPLH